MKKIYNSNIEIDTKPVQERPTFFPGFGQLCYYRNEVHTIKSKWKGSPDSHKNTVKTNKSQ